MRGNSVTTFEDFGALRLLSVAGAAQNPTLDWSNKGWIACMPAIPQEITQLLMNRSQGDKAALDQLVQLAPLGIGPKATKSYWFVNELVLYFFAKSIAGPLKKKYANLRIFAGFFPRVYSGLLDTAFSSAVSETSVCPSSEAEEK